MIESFLVWFIGPSWSLILICILAFAPLVYMAKNLK